MIVKIAKGRRDGKSDMQQLTKYITSGIDVEIQKLAGFGELTTYVAQKTNDDGEHKCTAVFLQHLISLDTAPVELYAVAAKNYRVTDPVLHMIVSWPEHERPSNDEIFAAGRRLLKAIHLDEHQAVMAIHGDTDNVHCHIEVNRVHPVSFKSQPLPWLHKELHREARHIEIDNNWSHDNGLFVVRQTADGQKFVVPNDGYVETDELGHGTPTGAAMQLEAWSDEPSLISFCRDVVAEQAIAALDLDPSWSMLHGVLSNNNMRLNKAGALSWQLEAITESGEIIRLPASRALRKLQLKTLVPKLGDFMPATEPLTYRPSAAQASAEPVLSERRTRSTKRDPDRREIRRLERAAERTALIVRYRSDKEAARQARDAVRAQQQEIRQRRNAEFDALKKTFAARRATIQLDSVLSPTAKRQQYSLLAMERIQERLEIDARYAEQLDALQGSAALIPAWRKWVEEQARLGDQAAISALRGMVYQERREQKKSERPQALDASANSKRGDDDDVEAVMRQILEHEKREDSIRPASRVIYRPYHVDALLSVIRGVKWSVTNNGNISYRRDRGDALFTDRGNKITFDRQTVTDEELQLALLHSRQMWGNAIILTGSDEVFRERMVKMAVELGMTVKNPELCHLQAKYQSELADRIVGPRPDMRAGENVRVKLGKKTRAKVPAAQYDSSVGDKAFQVASSDDDLRMRDAETVCAKLAGDGHKEIQTSRPGMPYSGTILLVTEFHVAQNAGRNRVTLHERTRLERAYKVGDKVRIVYGQDGLERVQTATIKPRRLRR